MNKLNEELQNQIDAFLPPGFAEREEMKRFLAAVNHSYNKRNIDYAAARQKADNAAESQRFFQHILDFMPADIAVIDPQHRYLFVNKNAIKDSVMRSWIIGKTDEEYHAFRGNSGKFSEERKKVFEEVLRTKQPKNWEEKIVKPGNEAEYNLRILHPVLNSAGEVDIVIVYGVNITDRKRTEEQVRKSETRFRNIFNNSQALICTHDLQGVVTDVNEASATVFGIPKEQLVGRNLSSLLAADKHYDFKAAYLDKIVEDGVANGVMVGVTSAGDRLYLLYQNFLVTGEGESPYVIGFSQDITARVRAEKALRTSEEKYRSIIENMNLGLLQVSPDENIVYANQSFCNMSGYSAAELVGRNAPQLFVRPESSGATEVVMERRKHGTSDAYEMEIVDKNGEPKWWLISGAPLFNDKNEFSGSIGIHLDITSQKRIEEELRKAKSEAESSAHAKEIFLANMSHEIRTPMNAIIGLGKLLARTQLDDQQSFYLDVIRNASDNLMVIINDLLDFSRLEAGKVSLEKISFSLNEHISKAVQILKFRAEEKGLLLECQCDERIAGVLVGDPHRLNQVLMNLLSNAVKFTDKGSVHMSCTLVTDRGDAQLIRFTVTDTGIGMSQEFLAHLFDKFSQEDESISRRYGGTGLGMSISKQLVELMGGTIGVTSEKNKGTSISFSLELRKGKKKDLQVEADIMPDSTALKGKRILLAEDNSMNRLLATTILAQYGATVTEAVNGEEAVEALKVGEFDIVLMDMQMPVMNGLDATRAIRAGIDDAIPILALTANAQQQEARRCKEAGMNDFITKPFDEAVMISLIVKWLGESGVSQPSVAKGEVSTSGLTDLSGIRSLGLGEEFVYNLTTMFLEEMTISMNQMAQAIEFEDMPALSDAAHKIKPSFQSFGVTTAMKDLVTLEGMKDSDDLVKAQKLVKRVRKIAAKVSGELNLVLSGMQI
ncbi:MAG: PAS domain S-box protein [Taibaiella sp.]|nr:PAS domain S-box protein [Taibaiella sp.]